MPPEGFPLFHAQAMGATPSGRQSTMQRELEMSHVIAHALRTQDGGRLLQRREGVSSRSLRALRMSPR